jgi:hypothetical protein
MKEFQPRMNTTINKWGQEARSYAVIEKGVRVHSWLKFRLRN